MCSAVCHNILAVYCCHWRTVCSRQTMSMPLSACAVTDVGLWSPQCEMCNHQLFHCFKSNKLWRATKKAASDVSTHGLCSAIQLKFHFYCSSLSTGQRTWASSGSDLLPTDLLPVEPLSSISDFARLCFKYHIPATPSAIGAPTHKAICHLLQPSVTSRSDQWVAMLLSSHVRRWEWTRT